MKCREESGILIRSFNRSGRLCYHKFCQSCFIKENTDLDSSTSRKFTCPCCHGSIYDNILPIEEPVLLCEVYTLSAYIVPEISRKMSEEDVENIYIILKKTIKTLEATLHLNPTSFRALSLLLRAGSEGMDFVNATHEIYCPAAADANIFALQLIIVHTGYSITPPC